MKNCRNKCNQKNYLDGEIKIFIGQNGKEGFIKYLNQCSANWVSRDLSNTH